MRKVRTVTDLEEIFYKENTIENSVFILEEFDCVQGVIERTLDTKESDTRTLMINKLKDEQMALMALVQNTSGESSIINRQLKDVQKKLDDIENCITIDALLTVLDGVVEVRGRCIIATTNHIDRIDSALVREGRFDHKIKLDKFNNEEMHELLQMMFMNYAKPKEFTYLANTKLREDEFTPVQIINLCHKYRSLKKVVDYMADNETESNSD